MIVVFFDGSEFCSLFFSTNSSQAAVAANAFIDNCVCSGAQCTVGVAGLAFTLLAV